MNAQMTEDDLLSGNPPGLDATYGDLKLALRRIRELEAEIAQLRAPVRPSLEVLQRMANGIDAFDIGRFKCAMAALPHEVPKLTASMTMIGAMGIGDKLDMLNGQRRREAERRGLRVIEGEPEPAA